MKFIDWFAGIGGFRRGMELAGHECVGFCEFDKHAVASYVSMHCITDEQRKKLEEMPFKSRQKEILKDEYRNGEWFSGDVARTDARDVPAADCWCFGFPCFAAGTLVLAERGYVPIEEIAVGDMVLTHKGRWRRVTSVMSRDGARIWRVRGFGILDTYTTGEHPYYVAGKGSCDKRFVPVSSIGPCDYSTLVLPDVEEDGHSPEWWYLVGRYLADGWRVERKGRRNGRVVISCSSDKRDRLAKAISDAGFRASYVDCSSCGKFHITKGSFYEELAEFGRYAHGKRLTRRALCLDPVRAESLYRGYMDGDGRCDREEATSTSAGLVLGMCILAGRIGRPCPAVYHTARPSECVIQGRVCRQHDTFTFRIMGANASAYTDGRYMYRPIRDVVETDGFDRVYNISVDEDESYVANGAIVHNCQDISVAGRQVGFKGNRSSLFFRITGLLGEIPEERKPRFLFIENVKNLLSVNRGYDFGRLLIELADCGYTDIQWQVLNSKYFGVPQNRERVFIVASLGEGCGREVLPITGDDQASCIKILGNSGSGGYRGTIYSIDGICGALSATDYKQPQQIFVKNEIHQIGQIGNDKRDNHNQYRVYDPEGISPCLNKMDGGGREPNIPVFASTGYRIRKLTPKECFRLQGWTDGYFEKARFVNSDSQLYKQAGNGVTVNVIYAIACRMK